MQAVSATNEVNYGAYDEALYWNGGYAANSKTFAKCLRINFFTERIQAELEFLCSNNTLRVLLIGYDLKHDLYLEKTWLLTSRHFQWQGNPAEFQILGKTLGLDLELNCEQSGRLQMGFRYFDQYLLSFSSAPHRKPLRNINPHDIKHWSYSEKHAMLDCARLELVLDGNDYGGEDFNLSYEWFGGRLPKATKELRCSFWQTRAWRESGVMEHKIMGSLQSAEKHRAEARRTPGLFSSEASALNSASGPTSALRSASMSEPSDTGPRRKQVGAERKQMAAALLLMGHDTCSSESAVWVEDKVRYRLPRITPSFSRSAAASLLPDLEWKIKAGEHFELSFCPFGLSDAPQLVFPHTKMQRLYGLFYGKLLSEIREGMPIQGAIGFIDYREIHWYK